MSYCQHTPKLNGNTIKYGGMGEYYCDYCSGCWTPEAYAELTENYLYEQIEALKVENAKLEKALSMAFELIQALLTRWAN